MRAIQRDVPAPGRTAGEHTVLLEQAEGLPDRGAADPQLCGEVRFRGQRGMDVSRGDHRVIDLVVHLYGQGPSIADGTELHTGTPLCSAGSGSRDRCARITVPTPERKSTR